MILDSYLKTYESIALIFAFYNRGFVINLQNSKETNLCNDRILKILSLRGA